MKRVSFIIFSLFFAINAFATEVAGVELPDKLTIENRDLTLNGAGVREKFFMDLYVGSLYLLDKEKNADNILSGDELMALRLNIISNMITSERMTNATIEGFENATKGNTAALQAKIDEFLLTFKDEIKKGDNFEMVYVPSEGVKIYKNNQYAKTIDGLEFKKALFGIWLSEKPAQKSLKEGMLGEE
ncbi:MAG: chalcone isomerase family protein [Pseudomonadales bacterium]|nr:chalcone isomerase family protein [Pseudomonadales bacterium]